MMVRALFAVAVLATVYAAASYVTDFPTDFEISAIVAVLALGAVFALQEKARRPEVAGRRTTHGKDSFQ